LFVKEFSLFQASGPMMPQALLYEVIWHRIPMSGDIGNCPERAIL
jgi:hypothetical protein